MVVLALFGLHCYYKVLVVKLLDVLVFVAQKQQERVVIYIGWAILVRWLQVLGKLTKGLACVLRYAEDAQLILTDGINSIFT